MGCRLGASPHLQLAVNVPQMRLDRPLAQAEPARDGLVARAFYDHPEDLSLPLGERFCQGPAGSLES